MRLYFSNTLLCSSSLAGGRVGPSGLQVNGRQANDPYVLALAETGSLSPGERFRELAFRVATEFGTLEAAEIFAALHFEQLPKQAALTRTTDADAPLWQLPDAVLDSVSALQVGQSIFLEYRFTGGAFESEDISLPDESDLVKPKVITLSAGEVSKAVTYDSPFATPPRFVQAQLSVPDGGRVFGVVVRESTRSAEGVTFDFDAAVPAAGTYKLLVLAIL